MPAYFLTGAPLWMKAIRSAMACGFNAFSKPSGISDKPELLNSFKSARSTISSTPPALRNVRLVGDSEVITPLTSRLSWA